MLKIVEAAELEVIVERLERGEGLLPHDAYRAGRELRELFAIRAAAGSVVDLEGLERIVNTMRENFGWSDDADDMDDLLATLRAGVREKCPYCWLTDHKRLCSTCHGTGGPVLILPLAAKEEKADAQAPVA